MYQTEKFTIIYIIQVFSTKITVDMMLLIIMHLSVELINSLQQLCVKSCVAQKWDRACKKRGLGGTSAGKDENGQMMCDIEIKDRVPSKDLRD